jgi:tetratricopeptide (TPR) repeat protein
VELKRFKACDVRIRPAEGVAVTLQTVQGLKLVAGILRSSGLVQVDEVKRNFSMHQLLQQAVGMELGWKLQCERMRALLHLRCGQFGDESYLDHRLYSIMREVLGTAVTVVGSIRRKCDEQGAAWCSGMLLRLHDVARDVYGAGAEFPKYVLVAAHRSLVADLVLEHVIKEGFSLKGRQLTLQAIARTPHINDVIKLGFDRKFDLRHCLAAYWCRGTQASVVANLVRALAVDQGCTAEKGLPLQVITLVPLIQDLIKLTAEFDLVKCLNSEYGKVAGLQLDGRGSILHAQNVSLCSGDHSHFFSEGSSVRMHQLRNMRWKIHTLKSNVKMGEKLTSEIIEFLDDGAGGSNWEIGVALGNAFHIAGVSCSELELWDQKIDSFERALCMRFDTLDELHPATATTINSIAASYAQIGKHLEAIELMERALRIQRDTLGLHPITANTISNLGASHCSVGNVDSSMHGIELQKQALRILESTVGRMHPRAARVIYAMSSAYVHLDDLDEAKELMVEALDISMRTLGPDHNFTKTARCCLRNIQQERKRRCFSDDSDSDFSSFLSSLLDDVDSDSSSSESGSNIVRQRAFLSVFNGVPSQARVSSAAANADAAVVISEARAVAAVAAKAATEICLCGIGISLEHHATPWPDKFGNMHNAGVFIAHVNIGSGADKADLRPRFTRVLEVGGVAVGGDVNLATQRLRGAWTWRLSIWISK